MHANSRLLLLILTVTPLLLVLPAELRADEPQTPSAADFDESVQRLPRVIVRGDTGTEPSARPAYVPDTGEEFGLAREGVAPRTPLALDGGPTVPLERTGSMDVLSPLRVHEATITRFDELANRLPGVSMRLYSGDEHLRPSISVRGMPDNGFTEYTAVLVDGINYSTLFYGWTALSVFPFTPERVWSAEVIRGAHAVRYGPNTVGGIVNLVTWPIPVQPTLRTRLTYGTFDYHASTTMIGGTDRRSGVGALVTFVEKAGDTYRDDAEFSLNELSVKTRWDIDPCTWIALNGFSWREEHQLVGRLTTDQLEQDRWQNPYPREIDWNGYAYGFDLTAHRDLNRSNWVELQGYYRLAHRALDSPRPSSGPPYDTVRSADSDNYNLGVELRGESLIPAGRVCNRLHWGLRYHQEWIDRLVFTEPIDNEGGDDKTYSQDATVRTHALSAYADDEITVGRFTVGVGARLEWVPDSYGKDDISGNSRSFEYFDVFPGVSASYQVGCNGAVFANYHQSFRAPQTWAYDFENREQDMDFENGQNAELGFRWQDWKGLDGNLVFWYVDFSDFLDYDDLTETYANLGGYKSYGVDLTLDADLGYLARPLSGWSVFGSVTRQTSKFTEGEFDGNHAPHVPDWIFSGGTRYEHRSGLYGVLETSYWDGGYITGENIETTDSYWLFDMRLGWRKQFCVNCLDVEVDLGLAAKNLFDNEYELQHRPGQWVPGAPRELFLDLSIGIDL